MQLTVLTILFCRFQILKIILSHPPFQIMQMKTAEPGLHTGIAKYFGLMFLFQAFAALCTVLSEQLYNGTLSFHFAVLSVVFVFLGVAVSIPAAVAVAVPESHLKVPQALTFTLSMVGIMCSALLIGPNLKAVLELPFVARSVNANAVAAIGGAFVVMSAVSVIRMFRDRQGRSGASMLLAGIVLAMSCGVFWVWAEPMCRRMGPRKLWPESCPVPGVFDHNSIMTLFLLVANLLAAEGAIRLMAAGSGPDFYTEIPHYLDATNPIVPSVKRTHRTYVVLYDCEDPYGSPPCPPYSFLSRDVLDRR